MTAAWSPALTRPRSRDEVRFAPFCSACGAYALPPAPSITATIDLACSVFGIDRDELVSARRSDALVRARAFVAWVGRTLGKPRSYPLIGALLGGRNHSTVVNLHQRAIALRLSDPDFAEACRAIGEWYVNQGVADHACH